MDWIVDGVAITQVDTENHRKSAVPANEVYICRRCGTISHICTGRGCIGVPGTYMRCRDCGAKLLSPAAIPLLVVPSVGIDGTDGKRS